MSQWFLWTRWQVHSIVNQKSFHEGFVYTEDQFWIICWYKQKIQITVRVFPQVGRIRKTAARRREYHILFMVITTVVCYLLCWMPYGVVAMMATFGRPGIITPIASVVPSLLAKSSTVINPLIYILMNKQVRLFKLLMSTKSWDFLSYTVHWATMGA